MGVSGEGRQFELVRFSGTPEQVSEAWRAERRKGVGGSDVAAIMGMSPYKSPYEVWAEKTGVVQNILFEVNIGAEESTTGSCTPSGRSGASTRCVVP